MAKKKTEIASSAATITTKSVSTKKVTEERNAKMSVNGMVEVVVKLAKFGVYAKGDVIVMHETTAKACVKNGAVTYK